MVERLIVLDTSVIVDVLRGRAQAIRLMQEHADRGEQALVPAPVVHELFYGAGRAGERERRRVADLLSGFKIVGFNGDLAKAAGLLEARLERAGKKHGRIDVQIAASALASGGSLVTRDKRLDVDGLDVITY